MAPTCASWDGPFGQFAYRGGRQSQADGKDFAFAVRRADGKKEQALTYSSRRLADDKEALKFAVHWWMAKAAVSRLTE